MQKAKEPELPYISIPRVELLGTERRTIQSVHTNQKYDLYISFPRSYWDLETRTTYQVLYVLNAQWDFPMLVAAFGNQNYDGLVPEIIIVGITWSGGESEEIDFVGLGMRDFTPSQIPNTNHGGAATFLKVFKDELIPTVEKLYPIRQGRGIAAASVSGLFAIYALLKEPNLFDKVILSSPAVYWNHAVIMQFENFFSKSNKRLAAKIFIGYGELEDKSIIKQFISTVKSRNYLDFRIESREIKSCGHAGNKPISFAEGLQSVYGRTAVFMKNAILEKLTGIYQSFETTVEIIFDERLFLKFPEKDDLFPLSPENETRFFIQGRYTFLNFSEENGKIYLRIELWDKTYCTLKIM